MRERSGVRLPRWLGTVGRRLGSLLSAVLLLGWLLLRPVSAGEASAAGPAKEDSPDKAAWRQLLDGQAAEYRIVAVKGGPHPLVPPKAVLRWANPTRITHFESCTYLWTFRGQPAAVACIFSTHRIPFHVPGPAQKRCHEQGRDHAADPDDDHEGVHRKGRLPRRRQVVCREAKNQEMRISPKDNS